jgi:hypothetical protein
MEGGERFLQRLLGSLAIQTFRDFEVVITREGRMAENTNAAIKKAKGEIIKILFMDDYLNGPDALQNLVDGFKGGWLATGCAHTENGTDLYNAHFPSWNDDMALGKNTVGSPSVVAFENDNPLLFDESLSFMLDCDLYVRLYERYGEPTLLQSLDTVIGIHDGQMTNLMSLEEKYKEAQYVVNKHRL